MTEGVPKYVLCPTTWGTQFPGLKQNLYHRKSFDDCNYKKKLSWNISLDLTEAKLC